MYDPNATLIGAQAQPQQRYNPPGYDPNATLMGAPQPQQGYGAGYDPNATLMGVPQPQQGYGGGYDPNATLMGVPQPHGYDPNATLIGQQGYDPNATLIGAAGADPNATLMGGGADPNATLMGGGAAPMLVNNSAFVRILFFFFFSFFPPTKKKQNQKTKKNPNIFFNPSQIHQQMNAQPQVLPHIKLIPHNGFFQTVDRDVLRTLKFGRTVRPFLLRRPPFFHSRQARWPHLITVSPVLG